MLISPPAQRMKAFTLIETLLAFAIIALLAALLIPVTSQMNGYAARAKSISNLRQIGIAARLYANDHNQQLPGRPAAAEPGSPAPEQWPALFCAYLTPSDPRVFLDAADTVTTALPLPQVVSNEVNNTAFIYNAFDDLGVDGQPPEAVALSRVEQPASVALLGLKVKGATSFYVDVLLTPLASLPTLLNTTAFNGGSQYLFVDGSIRFLSQAQYSNALWLANKTVALPGVSRGGPTCPRHQH